MLSQMQKELLNKHVPLIKKHVNIHYRTLSRQEKDELLSVGFIKVANRIDKYDERAGLFSTFLKNILGYELKNYYYREIKGYRLTTNINMISQDKLDESDKLKRYNIDINVWEKDKVGDKPLKPLFRFNTIYDNEIDGCCYDEKYPLIDIGNVDKLVDNWNIIQREFYDRVFIKLENPRTVADEVNLRIAGYVEEISKNDINFIEIGFDLGVDDDFMLDKYLCDIEIKNIIYKMIIEDKVDFDEVYYKVKLRDGSFVKNKMLGQIKRRFK